MPVNTRKHILVVDDEAMIREIVCTILSRDGHQMAEAPSAEEALCKFDQEIFDVVLTDFLMPGMKGDELARAVKQRDYSKPVIMLTGFPPDPTPPEIAKLILKPFDVQGLRQAMAEVN